MNLECPKEVYYGEEFEIKISFLNLKKNFYDLRIEFNGVNERLIGEIKDDNGIKTNKFLEESISNEEIKIIKLKVTEIYQGEAKIKISIKETGRLNVLSSEECIVFVNLRAGDNDMNDQMPQNIKSEKDRVLYKSKSEIIKNYAIYGFNIFCIAIIILLIIERKS